MAVVTGLQLGNLPTRGTRFAGKRLEERPSRISFRDASDESSRYAGPAIGCKTKGLLKAAQTEVTEPRAYEITRFTWRQSPRIQLPLGAR
jgi:hypothetical protein